MFRWKLLLLIVLAILYNIVSSFDQEFPDSNKYPDVKNDTNFIKNDQWNVNVLSNNSQKKELKFESDFESNLYVLKTVPIYLRNDKYKLFKEFFKVNSPTKNSDNKTIVTIEILTDITSKTKVLAGYDDIKRIINGKYIFYLMNKNDKQVSRPNLLDIELTDFHELDKDCTNNFECDSQQCELKDGKRKCVCNYGEKYINGSDHCPKKSEIGELCPDGLCFDKNGQCKNQTNNEKKCQCKDNYFPVEILLNGNLNKKYCLEKLANKTNENCTTSEQCQNYNQAFVCRHEELMCNCPFKDKTGQENWFSKKDNKCYSRYGCKGVNAYCDKFEFSFCEEKDNACKCKKGNYTIQEMCTGGAYVTNVNNILLIVMGIILLIIKY